MAQSPRHGKILEPPAKLASHLPTSGRPFYKTEWDALCRESEMVIPSGMTGEVKLTDLPTVPPPPQFWKLKLYDNTARAMDYWDKTNQQWDIGGIESDLTLSLRTSNASTPALDASG